MSDTKECSCGRKRNLIRGWCVKLGDYWQCRRCLRYSWSGRLNLVQDTTTYERMRKFPE